MVLTANPLAIAAGRRDADSMTRTNTIHYDTTTRFNWGFFDAQTDARFGVSRLWTSPHFDQDYEAGYRAGEQAHDAGLVPAGTPDPRD